MKKCKECEKEITDKQQFCNRNCYCAFKKKLRKMNCENCGAEFSAYNRNRKYCSKKCYGSVPKTQEFLDKCSKRNKGENNPNFGGKITSKVEVREKMLISAKLRGQVWTDENKKNHSMLMLGPTNKMRGNKHSEESKIKMSFSQKENYKMRKTKFKDYHAERIKSITDLGYNIKILWENDYKLNGLNLIDGIINE